MRTAILIFIALATTANCGKLKFKVATAEKPAPEKQDKGGEDANFSNEHCIAVADGVGGWNEQGIDPSRYSRRLMKELSSALYMDTQKYTEDPKQLAVIAASRNKEIGTSTLVIVTLDNKQGVLRSANIGDSGYMILRKNAAGKFDLVYRSQEQQHSFNFPFQIGTNGDKPSNAEMNTHQVLKGDLVIVGSDGLFDNMYNEDIIKVVNDNINKASKTLQSTADDILRETYRLSLDRSYISPFAKHAEEHNLYFRGGKSDDITIVVGEIIFEEDPTEDSQSL